MTSRRRFNGIAHDIAHHAQSGLSFLHPHVVEAMRRNGTSIARLDLLAEKPWPATFVAHEPLRLATAALRATFRDLVADASLEVGDLAEASLAFVNPAWTEDHPKEVRATFITTDGRRFQHSLLADG
jgi:hypothetical protein